MISINFFNILATVINILVLFLLMQKFLVKPLMNVIEKRENMINSSLKRQSSRDGSKEPESEVRGQSEKCP